MRKKVFSMLNTHRKMTLLSMFLCLCCTVAFAQSVKGVVKDETGEPVIGVNIVEKGTTNGTITDMDGKYTIIQKLPCVKSKSSSSRSKEPPEKTLARWIILRL